MISCFAGVFGLNYQISNNLGAHAVSVVLWNIHLPHQDIQMATGGKFLCEILRTNYFFSRLKVGIEKRTHSTCYHANQKAYRSNKAIAIQDKCMQKVCASLPWIEFLREATLMAIFLAIPFKCSLFAAIFTRR